MKTTVINNATVEEFLEQGRMIAKLIDQGQPLPKSSTISFEDPEDLLKLLRSDTLALFRAIKERPDSVTTIAARLQRERDAVQRDILELERLGIVKIKRHHTGAEHVQLTAQKFKLDADII
ncbi:transcriptional regulator [Pseudoduganella sp. FT55W]|uniref:Transcriptional regulator n=1 Tax=Duganella rivi TaxID=2666083 RepID=A0A7X4GT83_9BURK|nr:transcriptional regulator [Duganella rivi]MYM69255.1 transcriptional regulator [Duganella rivi]